MKVRKPVIENSVYSEILFRLGTSKMHVSELAKEFDELKLGKRPHVKSRKEQSVLFRQVEFLREEGYLESVAEKKQRYNAKRYFVNFDKIIDEFLDYALVNLNLAVKKYNSPDNIFDKKEHRKCIRLLKSNTFRRKCKDNVLIVYFFKKLLDEPASLGHYNFESLTLKDLFNVVIITNMFNTYDERIKYAMADVLDDRAVPVEGGGFSLPEVEGFIDRSLKKDYDFFVHELLPSINAGASDYMHNFIYEKMPVNFAKYLIDGKAE